MIRLPWNNRTAPNVMIEILDHCNIMCKTCYKRHQNRLKPLDEIAHDLEIAGKLRDLQMVSLTGGEPTLHPNLLEIVSLIKSKGYHTAMLTNGILLDDDFLLQLKSAGLDSILFHVDKGQVRPDLPKNPALPDIRKRIYRLIDGAIKAGLDVSFSWTLLEYSDEEIDFVMKMFFDQPDVSFLFLAKGTDPKSLALDRLPEKKPTDPDAWVLDLKETPSMKQVRDYFKKRFKISPFAYIPVQTSHGVYSENPIFISFFFPIIYSNHKTKFIYRFRSNGLDKALMYIPRILNGRFIHKTTQNAALTALRVFLNGLSRLRIDLILPFFALSLKKNSYIRNKMIVYDDGPRILTEGSVVVCEYCPTAIIRNDKLVRCCEIYYEK